MLLAQAENITVLGAGLHFSSLRLMAVHGCMLQERGQAPSQETWLCSQCCPGPAPRGAAPSSQPPIAIWDGEASLGSVGVLTVDIWNLGVSG